MVGVVRGSDGLAGNTLGRVLRHADYKKRHISDHDTQELEDQFFLTNDATRSYKHACVFARAM